MTKAEKLLQRMRQTPNEWSPDVFEKIYVGFGFNKHEGGNHTTYTLKQYNLKEQIPRHNPVAPCYARSTVEIIDKLLAMKQAEENKETTP